jgi:serine/threonine protein kinase/Tol biopolymer transport system component
VPLTSGVHLGPYEIFSVLGAGGMGEVYRGRDPRLGRDVAIKVLPANASADPGRLHRFEQEARAAAALNHPNILAVYDVGLHDGVPYIVSELLDGETLRPRLAGGPLPVRTALDYGVQIAHGLAAAHEKGIVHRDLKPDNVFITTDGRVKILDFGLAKLVDTEASGAIAVATVLPTAAPKTKPGLVLGTSGYMSPEQVRGALVDRRTDIFALGVVLYEMVTGRRAFERGTVPETMTAILRDDIPDIHSSTSQVSLSLEQVLRRCLDKDPLRRFQSTQDLAFALSTVGSSPSSAPAAVLGPVTPTTNWRRRVAIAAIAIGLLAAGAAAMVVLRPRPAAPAAAIRRLAISLPDTEPLAPASASPLGLGKISLVVSPDGSRIVYVASRNGTRHLVVRDLERFESRPLRGTDDAYGPFFSPDGTSVGFFSQSLLKKVSLLGGEPVTITEARQARSGAWLPDGSIVFGNFEGSFLAQVPPGATVPRTVATSYYSFQSLAPLPSSTHVLVDVRAGANPDLNTIEVVAIADGMRKVLVHGGTHPQYSDGRLLFMRGGALFAVPFDLDRLEVTGTPMAVVEGVRTETEGAGQVGVSRDGTLVYVEGTPAWVGVPVLVNRDGKAQPIGAPKQVYGTFALSPDGRRVAFEVVGTTVDVWVFEIGRGTLTRLTQEGRNNAPIWSPDGRQIAYSAFQDGKAAVMSRPVDGSGSAKQLWAGALNCLPYSWSPDGRTLALGCSTAESGNEDLFVLSLDGTSSPSPFVNTPFSDWGARFSPDGKWIAYISDASGQYEVYVRPFPGPGSQWQISNGGGEEPVWSRDGREIFYRNGTRWMVVAVKTGETFTAAPPRLLFSGPYVNVPGPSYDVGPDGRFVLIEGPPEATVTRFNVVLNWFEELRRLVPVAR